MRVLYRFVCFLIFLILILIVQLAESSDGLLLKRGQRAKCRTVVPCKEFCFEKHKLTDRIPRCFHHRCWCTTLTSPLNNPISSLKFDEEAHVTADQPTLPTAPANFSEYEPTAQLQP